MTQQQAACHYDRALATRVTRQHTDPCTHPAGPDHCHGCQPCPHPHCSVCHRTHLDDQHPNTCPTCVGAVHEDLTEIRRLTRQLHSQAVNAEGYTWASARIPGADAMVMLGPSAPPELVLMTRHYRTDHRRNDPTPPLAVLAHWEDLWRSWLGQAPAGRAGVTRAIDYLDEHRTLIAQATPVFRDGTIAAPPEYPEYSRDVGRLRTQLEATMHDEDELAGDNRGVECFECGARLVRRIRDRAHCRHDTPARTRLAEHLQGRGPAVAWLQVLASYGLRPTRTESAAAMLPSRELVQAARMPCDRCDQGGVTDPRPGLSWECPSCRMRYSPGEYATAVRRDLLDRSDVDGWTDIVLAADAATTLTGRQVPATTVRKWMDRGLVSGLCSWSPGQPWGQRLVFWPDVADRATTATMRRAG